MKRTIVILLALALVCSASAAFAGSIGLEEIVSQDNVSDFPDLSIFAELRASVPDELGRVTVTLSEPVDRLWANWMGKDEKPEELLLDENLKATVYTKRHTYQVGAMPPESTANLYKLETSKRYIIEFGALESQINWRTIQAQNSALEGDNITVVLPRWVLYRISDEVVFSEYSDSHNCTDIDVPDGFGLQKVDGFAVSWRYGSNGSDGSPNLAYITVQKGYIVIYSRNGKIQYVTSYQPDVKVFGVDVGSSSADKDTTETLPPYRIPEHISEFKDLPDPPSIYSFAELSPVKETNGKSITLFLSKPVDRIWANWMGKDEKPEQLTPEKYNGGQKAVVSTEGHKYQIGTQWIGNYQVVEQGPRQEIVWGAYDSYIEWATNVVKQQSNPGAFIKIVLPHWELQEITTGKVIKEYSDDLNCTDIHVPNGYKLVKQTGYVVSYQKQTGGSDGSPNLAYITEQNGFTVLYDRSGKIVSIIKQIPESHFFGTRTGTATVRFQISEFGKWYLSDITEVYSNNRSITAVYSRYGTGKLESYQVSDF